MKTSGMIVKLEEAAGYRAGLKGRRVVVTNGCFDLLHVGHCRYLEHARSLGDFLWVGLNGDASVRALKGEGRPVNMEADRAELLVSLRMVDAVTIFKEVRALEFFRAVRPDIYVKGGDYTLESLDREERAQLEGMGTRIEIVPLIHGKSTTKTLERVRSLHGL